MGKKAESIRVIDNEFPRLVEEYLEQESAEREAKDLKQKARTGICEFADVKDNYKGTMHITSATYDVTATFSLSETIDTDKVLAICAEHKLDPVKFFNVKFTTTVEKSKEEGFALFADAITTKPASPQIKVKVLEEK